MADKVHNPLFDNAFALFFEVDVSAATDYRAGAPGKIKTSLEEIMRSNRIEYSSITSMKKRLLSRFNTVALVITTFVDGECATEILNIVIYKSFPSLDTVSTEFLMTKTIWSARNVFPLQTHPRHNP